MVWACFSYSGVGPIRLIDAIMDQHVYVNILRNVTRCNYLFIYLYKAS